METVTLKTFDNYFTANILLTKMQDAGIKCYLFDENTVTLDPILSSAIGGIKLVVKKDDAAEAIELLKEYEKEYLSSVPCPSCGANEIILVTKPGAKNYLTILFTWLFSSYAVAAENIYQCQHCGYESESLPINFIEYN